MSEFNAILASKSLDVLDLTHCRIRVDSVFRTLLQSGDIEESGTIIIGI